MEKAGSLPKTECQSAPLQDLAFLRSFTITRHAESIFRLAVQYSGTQLGVLRGIDSVHVLIFGAFVELCCEHKGVLQSWKQWGPADFFCVFQSRFSSGLSLNAHVGFLVPVQWLPSSYSLSGGGCEIWNASKASGRKWGGGGSHTALAKRYRPWSAAKALD